MSLRFFTRRDEFLRGTSSQRRSVAFQAAMTPFVGAFFRLVGQVARGALWVLTDCQSVPASEARRSTAPAEVSQ
jgi:hypothetical protein